MNPIGLVLIWSVAAQVTLGAHVCQLYDEEGNFYDLLPLSAEGGYSVTQGTRTFLINVCGPVKGCDYSGVRFIFYFQHCS